ncbi:MAG: glycosyltransferase [Candidatus Shapirobacteria bacterium]|nr:glycosyltransferase [Candidatus Shapirobacteria bacterium]
MLNKNLKIAIYYDWLNQWGGAERVLLDLLELYPSADLYTLNYQPEKCPWLPKNHHIYSLNLKNKLIYSPFYAYKLEQIDFSAYDILISTTSHIGHCFLTLPKTLFICYFHNINRYLYQNPPRLLKPILNKYQSTDKIYGQRPDYLFCNSKSVASRIKKHYHRDASLIYPGIDLEKFTPNHQKPEPYFLIVSRLVPHKKIDLVIEAFQESQYQLKILGGGREEKYLKCLAEGFNNIEFINKVSEPELIKLYQNCTALIYPQEEDFGLTAIEAQACGRGVIAFNQGGATETIIDQKTGILFDKQDKESLLLAIQKYLKSPPSSDKTRLQAEKFNRDSFMLNFKKQVDSLWSKRQ